MAIIRSVQAAATTAGSPPVNQDILVASGDASTLTPKAAIYEFASPTAISTITATYRYGIGITDGTTQRCQSVVLENGSAGDCEHLHDTATVIQVPNAGAGTRNGEANWDSWQTGGSRIAWGDLPTDAHLIKATYFFGDDIECAVVEFTGAGDLGASASVTGLSFAPNFAFGISHYTAFAADTTGVTNAPTAIGYAVKTQADAIEQICFSDFGEDRGGGSPVTSLGASVIRNNRFIAQITDAAAQSSLELTAWTSDGATFTTRDSAGSIVTAILFVKFPDNVPLSAKVVTIPENWNGEVGFHNFEEPGFHFYDCFVIGTVLQAANTHTTSSARSRWSHGARHADSVITDDHGVFSFWAENETIVAGANTASRTSDPSATQAAYVFNIAGDDDQYTLNGFNPSSSDVPGGTEVGGTESHFSENTFQLGMVWVGSPRLIVSETENISDDFVTKLNPVLRSSDTENIEDAFVLSVANFIRSTDTENISDAFAMRIAEAIGETENISDGAVLITGNFRSLSETEQIVDSFVIVLSEAGQHVFADTEEIADQALLYLGQLIQADETEQISDAAVLMLRNSSVPVTDTEQISDQAILITGAVLVSGDTVNIVEVVSPPELTDALTFLKRTYRGTVFD